MWAETEIMKKLELLEKSLPKLGYLAVTVYDPTHGEIQAELHLPIALKSLDSLPVLPRYLQDVYGLMSQVGPLNRYLPNISGEWLPPFSGKLIMLCL